MKAACVSAAWPDATQSAPDSGWQTPHCPTCHTAPPHTPLWLRCRRSTPGAPWCLSTRCPPRGAWRPCWATWAFGPPRCTRASSSGSGSRRARSTCSRRVVMLDVVATAEGGTRLARADEVNVAAVYRLSGSMFAGPGPLQDGAERRAGGDRRGGARPGRADVRCVVRLNTSA